MHILDIAAARGHQAPNGPIVRPLLQVGAVAVLHVTLPAGGAMPEHDHGPSHVILLPRSGTVQLGHNGKSHDLGPASAVHVAVGERVSLANHGTEPAELLVVANPPDIAAAFAGWPIAT